MRTPPTAVLPRQVRWFTGRGGQEQFAAAMPYPSLDGSQACAGREALYDIDDKPGSPVNNEAMINICNTCKFQTQCGEWGIAHEEYGVWGAFTASERRRIRAQRGQVMVRTYQGVMYGLNDSFFPEVESAAAVRSLTTRLERGHGFGSRDEDGLFASSADLWQMEGPDV